MRLLPLELLIVSSFISTLIFPLATLLTPTDSAPQSERKYRIICFGAHPDDAEIKAGGVAMLWAAKGHAVKLVSVTNGDIGHFSEAGGPLARRRKAEVERASRIYGSTVEVLDNHDGELLPTLENRKTITRLIREWQADIVMAPRPNDYHPDHRYTGVLVQDASYMVAVPNFLPEVAPLKANPVFLYYSDRFEKPNPFTPDIIVGIDEVMEKKLDGLLGMVSQFYEGGALGTPELYPADEAARTRRRATVRQSFVDRDRATANRYRTALERYYGRERASRIQHAEAFEITEYGRRPDEAEIRRLFPFF